MKKVLISLMALAFLATAVSAETHVFWYKALANNYSITDSLEGSAPGAILGPNLPADAIVHEGMIASNCKRASEFEIVMGNGDPTYNTNPARYGRSAAVWSKDLNEMVSTDTSLITSAKIRGEYQDGWSDNSLCNAGQLHFKIGVVDFGPQLTSYWGGPEYVTEDAAWQDYNNTLDYAGTVILAAQEIVTFTAPAARPQSGEEPSLLDKQFFELDVTDQVKWILANTCDNKGSHSGQYALCMLADATNSVYIGKVALYARETCVIAPLSSDAPWTTDGNTVHLVVETAAGSLVDAVEQTGYIKSAPRLELASMPNPMTGSANLYYNTLGQKGSIKIFSTNGKQIFSSAVSGQGSIKWNAKDLSSGIYAYRLTVGNQVISKTLILMK